jgi:hypothetical protein
MRLRGSWRGQGSSRPRGTRKRREVQQALQLSGMQARAAMVDHGEWARALTTKAGRWGGRRLRRPAEALRTRCVRADLRFADVTAQPTPAQLSRVPAPGAAVQQLGPGGPGLRSSTIDGAHTDESLEVSRQ